MQELLEKQPESINQMLQDPHVGGKWDYLHLKQYIHKNYENIDPEEGATIYDTVFNDAIEYLLDTLKTCATFDTFRKIANQGQKLYTERGLDVVSYNSTVLDILIEKKVNP